MGRRAAGPSGGARSGCALCAGVGGCASAGSAASNQRAGCVRGGQAGNVVGSHLTARAAVGPQLVLGAAELGRAGGGGGRRGRAEDGGADLRPVDRPAGERQRRQQQEAAAAALR